MLLALLRTGTANTAALAELSGVPRTSVYQVMDSLTSQGLAGSVPSHGSATWFCPGWEVVVDRLDAAREGEQRHHLARTTRLRASLARHLSTESS